jgi:hypothetical protein
VYISFSLDARLGSTRPKNLKYISFSLDARLGSTRPKNLKISTSRTCSLIFWLDARLRSTRPKNLKRQAGSAVVCFFWLIARLRSTRPKNLKGRQAIQCRGGEWRCTCVYILFSKRYVAVYTTKKSNVLVYISFSLNAMLWSTRPKNLIGRQCSAGWGVSSRSSFG